MSEPSWMADVKAQLAEEGASLAPDAEMSTYPKPRSGSGAVVVLDRVRSGFTPDYCIHGYATCIGCDAICYLGSETIRMVPREAFPVCLECAAAKIPDAMRDGAVKLGRVDDHRRADGGPHD